MALRCLARQRACIVTTTKIRLSVPVTEDVVTLAGVTLEDRLPPNEYLEYYGPDFRLQPTVPQDKPNQNSPEYLEEVLCGLM